MPNIASYHVPFHGHQNRRPRGGFGSKASSLLGLEAANEVLQVGLHLVLEILNLLCEVTDSLRDLLRKVLGDLRAGNLVTTLVNNVGEVGRTTTVPGENVLSVAWNIRESSDGTNGDEVRLELLWGDVGNGVGGALGWLQGKQVGEEASNVRRGHGSTGDGVDGVLAADPGGLDKVSFCLSIKYTPRQTHLNVETWCEDVVASAVVGEVSALVSEGAGTNGDGVLSGGWGVVARVCKLLAIEETIFAITTYQRCRCQRPRRSGCQHQQRR